MEENKRLCRTDVADVRHAGPPGHRRKLSDDKGKGSEA